MRYGLKEHTIESISGVLVRHPAVEKAILYGSRAKGNFKHGSDIDLTLCGDELTTQGLGAIIEELDDLLLPYKIDLSIFEQLDHAKLREHIERVGVIFYQRVSGAEGKGTGLKAGWEIKTLGEVLQKTETTNPLLSPEVEFEYIDVSSVSNSTFQIEETQHLIGKDAPSRARKLVKTNDVLFATIRPTLRRIAIVPESLDRQVCSTGYFVLRPKTGIDYRYIFYWLFSEGFMGQMEALQKGASYPAVTDAEVRAQAIPFPPLPEQQRIASVLDEAFDGIAAAKANAEKNLQNARALFESHLQSVFALRGEGWGEKPLEKAAAIINGFAFKSTDFSPKGVVKSIKITNVGVREFVCESDCYLPEGFDTKYVAVSVQKGSIVIALTRTIISGGLKVAVVPDEYNGALLNQRVAAITTNPDMLTVPFLFAYLSTQTVVDYVKERVNTLMQPNLSINDLRSMPIPLPTVQEQNIITNQLDELRDETQRLESIYQQKLSALDALKMSLLDQAFTGQL